MNTMIRFFRDANGATSIEYAIVAAGNALASIVAVNSAGTAVHGHYQNLEGGGN